MSWYDYKRWVDVCGPINAKRCPYPSCNSNQLSIRIESETGESDFEYCVECHGCGIYGPVKGTEQEAIAAWDEIKRD